MRRSGSQRQAPSGAPERSVAGDTAHNSRRRVYELRFTHSDFTGEITARVGGPNPTKDELILAIFELPRLFVIRTTGGEPFLVGRGEAELGVGYFH
jgi:hypothetical protein